MKLGYWKITLDNVAYLGHRVAWFYVYGAWPSGALDHIDGRKTHNAIHNLRLASARENGANRGKNRNNTSGFKGVFWHPATGKWMASIQHAGRQEHLGLFNLKEDAARAYQERASEVFGAFANVG